MIEEIYSRKQYMEKRKGLREYKGSSSRVWEKIECRSKITREVVYSREKKL